MPRAALGPSKCQPSRLRGIAYQTAQTSTVLSSLPAASRLPSGEKASERTAPECPLSERSICPLSASINSTTASLPPIASRLPSGENAIESNVARSGREYPQQRSARGIPNHHGIAAAAARQPLAVRRNRHRHNPAAMTGERSQRLSGKRIPDVDHSFLASGNDGFAVRRKGNRLEVLVMTAEGSQHFAAAVVPDRHRRAGAAGCNALAVWRNRDRVHGRGRLPRIVGIGSQRSNRLAGFGVPDDDRAVEACRHDFTPIRQKRHRRHGAEIARKRSHQPSVFRVPNLQRPVRTS